MRCTSTICISETDCDSYHADNPPKKCLDIYNGYTEFDYNGNPQYGSTKIDPFPVFIPANENTADTLIEMGLFFIDYACKLDPGLKESDITQEIFDALK